MGKGAALKRGRSGRPRSKGKGSDDSDEDYMVEEDEDYMDEEDEDKVFQEEEDEDFDDGEHEHYNCDSFENDDKFEEKLEDSEDEEEMGESAISKRKRRGLKQTQLGTRVSDNQRNAQRRHMDSDDEVHRENFKVAEEEEEMNEVTISKRKRSCLDKKNWCSNRRNAHQENDDEDYNVEEEEEGDSEDQIQKFEVSEEDKEIGEVTRSNINMSGLHQKKFRTKTSNNRRNGQGKIDDEDYNFDEEEEDDEDEEFTVDESISLEEEDEEEEEEELVVKKMKRNNIKRTMRRKLAGSRKTKRGLKVASKVCNKRKRSSNIRRKLGSDDDDYVEEEFINIDLVRKGRTKKKQRRGTRKFTVQSDSEFVDSGPSEAEFTISEEEREQVREASKICRNSTVSLRSSCSYKIQDNESFAPIRKPFVTKGKEKVLDRKNEVVKQICGICFSEEGKNTVRGTLNCCSHYFCFACIFEWSKVESRCPLCKQRFLAISKSAKANTGIDVVLQIPERHQVYQPTEEEIRGYIDPYENVICTECHEGGDDELMLLCDLCDSPAHTYCVGLGREVPEGNWYCEGCRPASLGSSNDQIYDSLTGQRNLFHRLSSFEGIQEDLDGPLSTLSTQLQQGFGSVPSPRYFGGGIQALSPRSGTGAVTVSGRRQIHRHIQSMFSNHRTRLAADALFGISPNNSWVNQSHSSQRTPIRTPEIGASFHTQLDEESQGLNIPQNMQFLPVSANHCGGQLVLDTNPIPGESNIQETFRPSGISMLRNDQPINFSNSANVGCDYHLSSSALGEGSNFHLEEQVKPLVQNYLTSMSSTLTILDADSLEEIARKSTNTILAACGYHHHNPAEVFPMGWQPLCNHIENPLIHTSPMKGNCNSCFINFAKEVVKTILNSKLPHFLHVRN
ncbi:unnamed protein product [Rhodiola kirilowii]